jgi:hypothetical protein
MTIYNNPLKFEELEQLRKEKYAHVPQCAWIFTISYVMEAPSVHGWTPTTAENIRERIADELSFVHIPEQEAYRILLGCGD